MVRDPGGRLHLVTFDYAGGTIRYIVREPGATPVFKRRTIETVGAIQSRTSLAFDGQGQLWVAFATLSGGGHLRVGRICPPQ